MLAQSSGSRRNDRCRISNVFSTIREKLKWDQLAQLHLKTEVP